MLLPWELRWWQRLFLAHVHASCSIFRFCLSWASNPVFFEHRLQFWVDCKIVDGNNDQIIWTCATHFGRMLAMLFLSKCATTMRWVVIYRNPSRHCYSWTFFLPLSISLSLYLMYYSFCHLSMRFGLSRLRLEEALAVWRTSSWKRMNSSLTHLDAYTCRTSCLCYMRPTSSLWLGYSWTKRMRYPSKEERTPLWYKSCFTQKRELIWRHKRAAAQDNLFVGSNLKARTQSRFLECSNYGHWLHLGIRRSFFPTRVAFLVHALVFF